jgi:Big-like domain-containing protein
VGVFVLIAITITITITLMISIGNYSRNDMILAFASRSQSHYREEETKLIGMVDNVRPSIKITNPSPQSTFPFKEITINGTTFDSGSGVKLVEVFTHMYPFNNIFEYQEASPTSTKRRLV